MAQGRKALGLCYSGDATYIMSENEDADMTEVAIKLQSASITYDAALMSTSKIMQTSLLNYL